MCTSIANVAKCPELPRARLQTVYRLVEGIDRNIEKRTFRKWKMESLRLQMHRSLSRTPGVQVRLTFFRSAARGLPAPAVLPPESTKQEARKRRASARPRVGCCEELACRFRRQLWRRTMLLEVFA